MNDHDDNDFGEMNPRIKGPANMMTVAVFSPETPSALPSQPVQTELTSPIDVLLRPTSAIDDIDRMLIHHDVMRIAFLSRVYAS
jgi:hypothetical protein